MQLPAPPALKSLGHGWLSVGRQKPDSLWTSIDPPSNRICRHSFPSLGEPLPATANDQIDLMLQRGQIPIEPTQRHGYSDFTNPVGKFMDLLEAGAVTDARAIQAEACKTWPVTRQTSALCGKFWAWDVEINLDTLCTDR